MTTERTYSCNLCRTPRNPDSVVGVKFTGARSEDIQKVHATEAENHLCYACIKAIKAKL